MLWVENYKRKYRPEYNDPKTSADVQPIRRNPNPTVNNRENVRKPPARLERKHQNPRNVDNPPLAHSRPHSDESGNGSRSQQDKVMASTAHTWADSTREVKPGRRGKRNPRGRSESQPTHRKCVSGQGKERRPTGNLTGGGACPARDRGRSMIPLETREVHQHACSHARSQLVIIMREQRPSGEGSRVPAKERRQ